MAEGQEKNGGPPKSSLRSGGGVLLLDGGLATELESRGHTIHGDPLWSARLLHSDPQAILNVHKSYLESGADVLITASYQASVEGFQKELGMGEEEALDLIGRSVTLAKEARQQYKSERNILIAGSVGPYGACQHDGSEYTGDYVDHMTRQELEEWHRPRVRRLVEEGADLLACETIPAVKEAMALVHLVTTEFPASPAWISFSCRNGSETCHGEGFREAVKAVVTEAREGGRDGHQIVAVGVNCSDPTHIQPLLKSCSDSPETEFVVYPNIGGTWDHKQHCWTGRTGDISSEAVTWMELGATYIGGCCSIGPDHIRSLRSSVDLFNQNNSQHSNKSS